MNTKILQINIFSYFINQWQWNIVRFRSKTVSQLSNYCNYPGVGIGNVQTLVK